MKRAALLLFLAISTSSLLSQEYPNIVLFLVDDMGLMDTSLPFLTDENGNPKSYPLNEWYRTPNMERLADRGIRFSTFYAQSVCSPSRVSIMTGQNSARHRTTNWIRTESNNRSEFGPEEWNWNGISKETPTIPRLLKEAGYRTIHIGKAHFGPMKSEGEDPLNIGFDVNIAGSGIGHPGSYYGENGYGLIKGQKERAVPDLEKYHGTDTFLTEALTLEAKDQLKEAAESGKPFFLYLSHYAVHAPFEADKRFIGNYQNDNFSEQAKAFATLIEGMDKSLGNIMNYLEKLKVAENTLIIFLGDNGSDAPLGNEKGHYSSAPLRGKKGSEYEGGVRIPFIAAWGKPDKTNKFQQRLPVKAQGIQTQLGTIMDIYPTLLNLTGIKIPENHTIDGYDLAVQFTGEADNRRPEMFLTHFPHEHRGSYFTTYREEKWKLIYNYNPRLPDRPIMELYNLNKDPFEIQNLATTETEQLIIMKDKMKLQLEKENALYPVDENGKTLKPW